MPHSLMRQLNKNQSRYSYLALLTVSFVTLGNNAFSRKCGAMMYKP